MESKKLKIMVVEDESMLLDAITKKLTTLGINVVSCNSGKQAVTQLQELTEVPDAVWLDYYLKDMNGLEFMAELKKHVNWDKIPVLVVSNSASDEKVGRMLEMGASQYILKAEHRLDEIVQIIQDLVNKSKSN